MSQERTNLKLIMDLIDAYAVLLPFLPVIVEAVEAEREVPGYGAEAVMFRRLIAGGQDERARH